VIMIVVIIGILVVLLSLVVYIVVMIMIIIKLSTGTIQLIMLCYVGTIVARDHSGAAALVDADDNGIAAAVALTASFEFGVYVDE